MQKLSMEQLQRPSVEEFKTHEKLPVTLVLDNVRSLHNVGSAFRTADGFALEQIALCGITGTPPHREIEKTALGATQSIEWMYFDSTIAAAIALKAQNYKLIAVEQAKSSIMLHEFLPNVNQKYALIFGNEVNGVSDDVMQIVEHCIEIPQFGTKHSLNISVATGIVLWEFYNKLRLK